MFVSRSFFRLRTNLRLKNSHFLQMKRGGGEVFEGDYKFKQLKKIDKQNVSRVFINGN